MAAISNFPMLLWYIFISIRCIFVTGDNPTSIIPASTTPDPGYIIAESNYGLGNRLRVLAAYMYVAEYKFSGAHLVFIWEINEPCPGHFLSVFQPIPHLMFATNASRYVLDKNAKINYENSAAVFPWIMKMNEIPRNRRGLPNWNEIEYNMYSRYIPTKEIMYKALEYIEKHNICNASAMHIRETDLKAEAYQGKKRFSLTPYVKFIHSRPITEKVFLLSDNPATQSFFIREFGPEKILIYSSMENDIINHLPLRIDNYHKDVAPYLTKMKHKIGPVNESSLNHEALPDHLDISGNSSANSTLAKDHRYVTLENTVVEVIIAAHAKVFKGSPYSSFSELIMLLGKIGRKDRGWCATS